MMIMLLTKAAKSTLGKIAGSLILAGPVFSAIQTVVEKKKGN